MTGVVAHEAPWPSPNPPGNGICHRKKWRWQGKEMEYIGSLAVKYMFTLHLHIFCPCADHLFFGIYTSKAASGAPLPPIQASNCKDGREFITVLKVPNKMKQVDMYLTGAKKQTSRFRSTWIRFKALRIRDSPRFHRVCRGLHQVTKWDWEYTKNHCIQQETVQISFKISMFHR